MNGLIGLFHGMVGRGNEIARQAANEPAEVVSATVRFSGDLRRFLEAQAEALGGVSIQTVITATLTGVMHETLAPTAADRVDIVPARIFRLFELHGIDLPIAANILGVPFADMKPERLVNYVTTDLINRLAEDFAVERRWLLGDTDAPGRKVVNWNKSSYSGAQRILKLARHGLRPKVHFLKGRGWDLEKAKLEGKTTHDNNILIVVELTRKVTPDDPKCGEYNTYEMWEDVPWDSENGRLDVLSLVKFCQKMNGMKHQTVAEENGLDQTYFLNWGEQFAWGNQEIPDSTFNDLRYFKMIPSQIFRTSDISRQKSGVVSVHGGAWTNLEDFVESSEESAVSKCDESEHRYVVKRYKDMMEMVIRNISYERKAAQQEAESTIENEAAETAE